MNLFEAIQWLTKQPLCTEISYRFNDGEPIHVRLSEDVILERREFHGTWLEFTPDWREADKFVFAVPPRVLPTPPPGSKWILRPDGGTPIAIQSMAVGSLRVIASSDDLDSTRRLLVDNQATAKMHTKLAEMRMAIIAEYETRVEKSAWPAVMNWEQAVAWMKAHPGQVLIDKLGDLHRIRNGKPREIRCCSFKPNAKWRVSQIELDDMTFTVVTSE